MSIPNVFHLTLSSHIPKSNYQGCKSDDYNMFAHVENIIEKDLISELQREKMR